MAHTIPKPDDPIVRHGEFQMRDKVLTLWGYPCIEGSRLRQLFDPDLMATKQARLETKDEAKTLFGREFFKVQLEFHGCQYPSRGRTRQLEKILRNAVSSGRCDLYPPWYIPLRREAVPVFRQWERDMVVWNIQQQQAADAVFETCKKACKQAKLNVQCFLDKYYLTYGKPDQNKMPEPLALYGLRHLRDNLEAHVPGLVVVKGGTVNSPMLCTGWDSTAVWAVALDKTLHARLRKDDQECKWREDMDQHLLYLDQRQEDEVTKNRPMFSAKFDFDEARGSYIINCEEINKMTEDWPEEKRKTMTMDISKGKNGTLRAAIDLGVFEGTVILSQSEEKLDAITDNTSDSEGTVDGIEDTSPAQPSRRATPRRMTKEGKARTSRKVGSKLPSLERRVLFRLRGREIEGGTIVATPQPGHLDFLSNNCAKFTAVISSIPNIGKDVRFQGYKVLDAPRRGPAHWEAFSWGGASMGVGCANDDYADLDMGGVVGQWVNKHGNFIRH